MEQLLNIKGVIEMENRNNITEKEQVAMVVSCEATVTIPLSEYDKLRKKETLLDLITFYEGKYSWKAEEFVKIVCEHLCGKDDSANAEDTDA